MHGLVSLASASHAGASCRPALSSRAGSAPTRRSHTTWARQHEPSRTSATRPPPHAARPLSRNQLRSFSSPTPAPCLVPCCHRQLLCFPDASFARPLSLMHTFPLARAFPLVHSPSHPLAAYNLFFLFHVFSASSYNPQATAHNYLYACSMAPAAIRPCAPAHHLCPIAIAHLDVEASHALAIRSLRGQWREGWQTRG